MRNAKTVMMGDVSGFEGRHQFKKLGMREAYDRLERAYDYILPCDRYLLEQYFVHRTSLSRIAESMRHCPKTIRRRLKKLIVRIHSAEFDYLVLYGPTLSRDVYRVGDCIFLKGYSFSQTRKLTGLSLHHIRSYLLEITQSVGL